MTFYENFLRNKFSKNVMDFLEYFVKILISICERTGKEGLNMRVLKDDLKKAAGVLRAAGLYKVSAIFATMLENNENTTDYVELIDTNAYVSSILWEREDIVLALEEEGFVASDENIRMVKDFTFVANRSLSEQIEEQSDSGYYVIRDAISYLTEELEKEEKERAD